MNMKYLVAASALALTAASGAQAADVVMNQEPAPVVASPAFSWTGFYAGGQIGGSWSDTDQKITGHDVKTDVYDFSGFGKTFSPDPSGFIGGLYAGYNYDLGNNIVIGADTDWVWGDMDENDSKTYFKGDTANQYKVEGKIKEKWAGSTRARVGYAVDRWMPYFAGGVAYAKIDSDAKFSNADGVFSKVGGNKTLTGYTLGAGLDYAMTDNIILRAEYRYTDFGDKDFGNKDFKYNVDYKTNDVRVGVAYKF